MYDLQIVSVETAVDLSSGLRRGKRALIDVFQFNVHWAEVQSCFVRVR